jgi:Protein of unknown function (DUF2958)
MKLLTDDVKARLPALYSQEEVPAAKVKVVAKFFTPDANATWYATEGGPEGDDYRFFGWADLGVGCGELGYFMLSELSGLRGLLGFPVERDEHFEATLAEVMAGTRR